MIQEKNAQWDVSVFGQGGCLLHPFTASPNHSHHFPPLSLSLSLHLGIIFIVLSILFIFVCSLIIL